METALEGCADKTAYTFNQSALESSSLSYAQLLQRAKALAAALQQSTQCPPGSRAVLLCRSGFDYLTALLGCFYAGVVPVPVYAPRPNASFQRIQVIAQSSQASLILSTADILAGYRLQPERSIVLDTLPWLFISDLVQQGDAASWRAPQVSSDDLLFLQFTSGSTGFPKGVMVSHRNLLANLRLLQQQHGCSPDSVGVSWLPPYHDMGLVGGLLQPLYSQFTMHLLSPPSFLQRPMLWLEILSKYAGTWSGSPNFGFDLCSQRVKPEQLSKLDLSHWKVAVNGAEPIHASTLRRFSETFAPCGFRPQTFFPSYGMAEATLYICGSSVGQGIRGLAVDTQALANHRLAPVSPAGSQQANTRVLTSVGRPLPGMQALVVNPETARPCPEQEVGEVWLRGDSIASGYWCQHTATQAAFDCTLRDVDPALAQGWLRTGDLGALHEGELYITGRLKDLIIIGGQNHYPHDIEATVMAAGAPWAVHHVAAFSIDHDATEQLAVVVELRQRQLETHMAELERVLHEAISKHHQLHIDHIVFVPRGAIARTSSGKTQRKRTRELWLNNQLPVLASCVCA